MGYRYGRGYTLPRKKNVLRFKRACRRVLRRLTVGLAPTVRQAQSLLSRAGYLKHCNARGVITRCLDPIGVGYLKHIVRMHDLARNMAMRGGAAA